MGFAAVQAKQRTKQSKEAQLDKQTNKQTNRHAMLGQNTQWNNNYYNCYICEGRQCLDKKIEGPILNNVLHLKFT